MRKITIYSTKGKSGSFESDATTWGAVRSQVSNIVGSLDNLIATENINKTNLGHEESVLPEGNFTIFLRPEKTKSGKAFSDMSFKELRDYIKSEGQSAKDFLNLEAKKNNRNWTQLPTEEMQSLLEKYANSPSMPAEQVEKVEKTSATGLKAQLQAMTRSELKDFIEEEELEIVVKKSMTDEEVVEAIINELLASRLEELDETEDFEEEIDEEDLEEEFENLSQGFC